MNKIKFDWNSAHHLVLKSSDSSGGTPAERYIVKTYIFHKCPLDELTPEDYDNFETAIREAIDYSIQNNFE